MRICLTLVVLLLAWPAAADEPKTLYWEDLMPEGGLEDLAQSYEAYFAELERKLQAQTAGSFFDAAPGDGYAGVAEGSTLDVMPQLGTFEVVEALDGLQVRLPGFVLPFEYAASGEITEFLLVPYYGACIHTPPPPPNQVVYVRAENPIALGDQWDAIWAIGTLRTQKNLNDLGSAAYTLDIDRWEAFEG